MFEYKNIQDFICRSLVNKVLVKVGDTELHEKIIRAYHDPDTNSIIVDSDKSQTYVYNDSFVLVPRLIEIDWDSYIAGEKRKFGDVGTPIDEVSGHLFTTEEFHDLVDAGGFVDSDGFGLPSNGTYEIYVNRCNVQVLAAMKYSKTVTHVSWYNN